MSSLRSFAGITSLGLISLFLVAGVLQTNGSDKTASSYLSDAEEAINRTVQALFQSFSFEKGGKSDYQTLRQIFTESGRIIFVYRDSLINSTLEEYIAFHKKVVEASGMTYFHEFETGGKTHHYGDIAHRISTFANYINTTDSINQRGVMSFQLVNIGGEWLIQSLMYEVESPDNPLPSDYLK